ncbi:hypothetical protein ACJIZ3_006295 [Penstemon smallii]|uniref:Uncharacterized protein n=1 Tax=Penstemon smallii TaxID=265156 RepID=A0ABD3S7K8_9LAMI
MDIAGRLFFVQQEIQTVENEKLQQEQMLDLFWEHPPVLDPEVVGRMMQLIREEEAGPSNPVRPFPYHDDDIIGGDSVRAIDHKLEIS